MSTITELERKRDSIRDELTAAMNHSKSMLDDGVEQDAYMSSTVRLLQIALVEADRDLMRGHLPTKTYEVSMPGHLITAPSMLDAYDQWLDYLQEFCEERDATLFEFEEREPVNSEGTL